MTVPNQRDPDSTQVIKGLMGGLADLKANVISRWGRIPHAAADPATPPDGAVWLRSDDLGLRHRSNGATIAVPRGFVGGHTLTTVFTTSATHTTLQDEGLTVTASEIAGRRWRFSLTVNPYPSGGANGVQYALLRDGVTIRTWTIPTEALSTTVPHGITLTHIETIAVTHASSVFKLQLAAFSTNTAVTSHGSATVQRQLIIDDIGV